MSRTTPITCASIVILVSGCSLDAQPPELPSTSPEEASSDLPPPDDVGDGPEAEDEVVDGDEYVTEARVTKACAVTRYSGFEEELGTGRPSRRNWAGIGIAEFDDRGRQVLWARLPTRLRRSSICYVSSASVTRCETSGLPVGQTVGRLLDGALPSDLGARDARRQFLESVSPNPLWLARPTLVESYQNTPGAVGWKHQYFDVTAHRITGCGPARGAWTRWLPRVGGLISIGAVRRALAKHSGAWRLPNPGGALPTGARAVGVVPSTGMVAIVARGSRLDAAGLRARLGGPPILPLPVASLAVTFEP
jgi:hypothetical protein